MGTRTVSCQSCEHTWDQAGGRTVYDPPDLYLGTASDGRTVVVSAGADAAGFDAATGRQLWHTGLTDRPGLPHPRERPPRRTR